MIFGFGTQKVTTTCSPRPAAVGANTRRQSPDRSQLEYHLPMSLTVAVERNYDTFIERYSALSPMKPAHPPLLPTPAGAVSLVSMAMPLVARRPGLTWPMCSFSTPWPAWAWAVGFAGQCGHCGPPAHPGSGAARLLKVHRH